MSAGSFSGFGTESNLISGTVCCARREELRARNNPIENFIRGLVYRKTLRQVSGIERMKARMQKQPPIIYAVLVGVIAILSCAPQLANEGGITWLSDYKEALRL